MHGVVAGPEDAVLRVPPADRRAGAVAVEPHRVGVDVRIDPLDGRRRAGRGEHLVARSAHGERCRRQILHAVAGAQGRAEPVRRRGLAVAQDVAVALGVGPEAEAGQADVAVHEVAGLDDGVVRDGGQQGAALLDEGHSGPLQHHGGLEPRLDPEVVEALPEPPGDVQRRRRPGAENGGGVRLVDHLVHEPVEGVQRPDLLRQPGLEPSDGELLGRHQPVGVGPERLGEQPVLGV
jgi:hypothetical protein